MPVASEADKRAALLPGQEILREIEGLSGTIELEILYDPRPDYGRLRPTFERRGALGLWCRVGAAALILHGDLPSDFTIGQGARGTLLLRAGERRYLSLVYTEEAPAIIPALGATARAPGTFCALVAGLGRRLSLSRPLPRGGGPQRGSP